MLLPVDLNKFWEADALAHEENCFSKNATQVAMGIRMSDECVFSELNEPGNPWGETARDRRMSLNKRYNDLAETIVGKRLLNEYIPKPEERFPAYKQIGEVFGGQYTSDGNTTWLHSDIRTPNQLEKQLDFIDNMNFAEFILPPNWESEKRRLFEAYGKKPSIHRHIRGPVTLATSIFGVENFIFLLIDEPDLSKRLSETITQVIFNYIDLFDQEAGYNATNAPHGFSFADDDCCLLNSQMYEAFGYPILKAIFDKTSPDLSDKRYQHSDSAMGHLLPILSKLNLTGCNFGPTLTVREIRSHMPHTRIDGQLAPFTFMRNNQEDIIAEVKRDCDMSKENDLRGVNISTAGSINNGSSLVSMRTVMHTIQKYGQYDN